MFNSCLKALSYLATALHLHQAPPKPSPLEEDLIKAIKGQDSTIGKELEILAHLEREAKAKKDGQ